MSGAVTLAELEQDPHPALARLRATTPVAWIDELGGWLVLTRAAALEVMRDDTTYTVDDPRFTTALVVGPSMLSLDGAAHTRHRLPFARRWRLTAIRETLTAVVERDCDALIDAFAGADQADLRRQLAGPLAARSMIHALALDHSDPTAILRWYDAIVRAVSGATAGVPIGDEARDAYAQLCDAVRPSLPADRGGLTEDEALANVAVLLFGGIETTEGMLCNLLHHLLAHPDQRALVAADRTLLAAAIEESLRFEPAAAVVDRYAVRDAVLAGVPIGAGDLVEVSLAAANRDPAVFAHPDRFEVRRPNARLQVAFAHGPHVCLGMHLARVEATVAVNRLLDRLPDLELDPALPTRSHGLVFRKPATVAVRFAPTRAV